MRTARTAMLLVALLVWGAVGGRPAIADDPPPCCIVYVHHPTYDARWQYHYNYKYLAHHKNDPRYYSLRSSYNSWIYQARVLLNQMNSINGPQYDQWLTESNDKLRTIQEEKYPPEKETADTLLEDATQMDMEHEAKREDWEGRIVDQVRQEIEDWITQFHNEAEDTWARLPSGLGRAVEYIKTGDRYYLTSPERVSQMSASQNAEDGFDCYYLKKSIFVPSGSRTPQFKDTDSIRVERAVCVGTF